MRKMKRIMLSALLIIFFSCNGQRKEEISKENKDEKRNEKRDEQLSYILAKQIEYGKPSFDNSYKYNSKDLEVILPKLKDILLSKGFVVLKKSDFEARIKTVFGRVIAPNSDSKYLYVNFLDKCNVQPKYFPNDIINYFGNFIIKNENFITDSYAIPQMIDYQKEFVEISIRENNLERHYKDEQGEEVSKYLWKDDKRLNEDRKNNIQILVARNMYLFNDSRAHFKWLILNDEYFMQGLVTTFGYYEDKELLKWVIESTKFESKNANELDKLFWNKKCDGTIKLNTEIYSILKEIITRNDPKYMETLKEYVNYLLYSDTRNELSVKDRANLLAHLVYFGEQYRYDEKYNDQSFFMQRIELLDLGGVLRKEIERNNFYNLPNYKNLYKKSEEYQDQLVTEYGG
jgi:hypothetical protein